MINILGKKKISSGSCAQDFFEVKAKDPNTIRLSIGGVGDESSEKLQSLIEENLFITSKNVLV